MDVIQILTAALGVIGLAGGAYAYFRKTAGDSTIKYQADAIDALNNRNAVLEKDNAALRSENETLKRTNTMLQGLAQGSPQLVELTEQIKELVSVVTGQKAKRGKR